MSANKDLNRLKVVLVEKKKSSLWLSRQLGCAPTTVSKWCTNSSQPPLEMLRMTEEQWRSSREDLSEEELEVYDILKKEKKTELFPQFWY